MSFVEAVELVAIPAMVKTAWLLPDWLALPKQFDHKMCLGPLSAVLCGYKLNVSGCPEHA